MFNRYLLISVIIITLSGSLLQAQIHLSPESDKQSSQEEQDNRNIKRALSTIRSLISLGKYEQANSMLSKLEQTYGARDDIIGEKKRVLKATKDFDSLREIITAELAQSPDNFGLTCQMGEVYFLSDSLKEAEATWEKAFTLAGNNSFNYVMLAHYYQGYGYYNEAASVYARGREILDQPELFVKELADLYITQKSYTKAVTEYLKLINLTDSSNIKELQQTSWQISEIFDEAEDPESIIESVEMVAAENPDNALLLIILGDLYLKSGHLPEAFSYYQRGDSLGSSRGLYLEKFIELCFEKGEYSMTVTAADYYLSKFSKQQDIAFENAVLYKAKSLAEMGSYTTAFELLEIIENDYTSFKARAEALYIAGEIYADKLNNKEKAIEKFNELVKSSGNLPLAIEARIRLAEFDIQSSEFNQAITKLEDITKSRNIDELNEKALFLMAEIEFYRSDYKKAEKAYNTLYTTYPRSKFINDCLERMTLIIDNTGDSTLNLISKASWFHFAGVIDSAIIYLKQAAENSGSKAYEYVLYTLPLYYNESGNWEMASGAFQHYLTAFEDGVYTDRVLLHLAEIYYQKAERPDKADELLNRLITDYPNSPLLEKARLHLNRLNES